MRTMKLPKTFERVASGCALAEMDESVPQIFIRESEAAIRKLPRLCLVDLKLGVWEFAPVLATILMARVEKRPDLTYRIWLNAAEPLGVALLKNFARERYVFVHLATDEVKRTFRTRNTIALRAARLVHEIRERRTWTKADFVAATERLDRLYPSLTSFWLALRNEPFPF